MYENAHLAGGKEIFLFSIGETQVKSCVSLVKWPSLLLFLCVVFLALGNFHTCEALHVLLSVGIMLSEETNMESKYFPQNLRYLRETAELSQAELAEKIFVSRTLLVKLETGAANPTEDHVDALCKYFGVEKDELLNKNLGWDISRKLSVRRMMESKINLVIVIVCLVILASFVLLLTLPILIEGQSRGYYCAVGTDGSKICYPKYGTTNTNALLFGMNHGNYLAFVDLVFSSVSFLLGICFFSQNQAV